MQNKSLFFGLIVFTLFVKVDLEYSVGAYCSTKYILNGNTLMYDGYYDHKEAYNGIASCASLRSDENTACCYIKVKFKNQQAGKKYTHRGCVQITGWQWQKIEDVIKDYEGSISHPNITVEKQDVEIDCHSRLLKLTGLVLLAFLL